MGNCLICGIKLTMSNHYLGNKYCIECSKKKVNKYKIQKIEKFKGFKGPAGFGIGAEIAERVFGKALRKKMNEFQRKLVKKEYDAGNMIKKDYLEMVRDIDVLYPIKKKKKGRRK